MQQGEHKHSCAGQVLGEVFGMSVPSKGEEKNKVIVIHLYKTDHKSRQLNITFKIYNMIRNDDFIACKGNTVRFNERYSTLMK